VDVVLARPLQLDRRAVGAVGLGDRHRLDDVIGARVGAPAEAAARRTACECSPAGDRGPRSARHSPDPRSGTDRRPRSRSCWRELDHRIERLHRRMREIGKFIAGRQLVGGTLDRLRGIAVLARRRRGLLGQLPILGHQAAELRFSAWLSSHSTHQRIAPLLGGPEVPWRSPRCRRHLHHLDHAGYRCAAARGRRCAPSRRTAAGASAAPPACRAGHHIERELRVPSHLRGHIDPRRRGRSA
jgi:hypothetical protein